MSLLKERNEQLGRGQKPDFIKVQRLWVVGQVFQLWEVNVFWVISPHTEGDDKEYRRCTQTSASCPPLPRDGLQGEVQAGKGAGGDAS